MFPLAMISTDQILTAGRWSGYFTLFCAVLSIVGWVLKWGTRFRLVGVTGFMGVLTGGLFALSLGFYNRPEIAGAVRFARIYDTGSGRVVIAVPPTDDCGSSDGHTSASRDRPLFPRTIARK